MRLREKKLLLKEREEWIPIETAKAISEEHHERTVRREMTED